MRRIKHATILWCILLGASGPAHAGQSASEKHDTEPGHEQPTPEQVRLKWGVQGDVPCTRDLPTERKSKELRPHTIYNGSFFWEYLMTPQWGIRGSLNMLHLKASFGGTYPPTLVDDGVYLTMFFPELTLRRYMGEKRRFCVYVGLVMYTMPVHYSFGEW